MTTTAIDRLTALRGDALIRVALKLDAVITGANGAAYLAAGGLLDGPLGLPASFLHAIGAFLIVFAACVWYVATRVEVNRRAVAAIVALNAIWVVDSIVVAATGAYDPTTGGSIWIVLQAVVVAGFAALQAYAMRQASQM
jgi:hypothetical protein